MSIKSMKTCKMKKVDNFNINELRCKHVLKEKEAAFYLGVNQSFLCRSRSQRPRDKHVIGPSYLRFGRAIRYLRSDLDFWLKHNHAVCPSFASNTVVSTDEMEDL